MRRLTKVAVRVERASASLLSPLTSLPPRFRALVVQSSLAILLLALGIVIRAQLAWMLIAIAVTVLVLLGIAGWLATRAAPPRQAAARPKGVQYEGTHELTDAERTGLTVAASQRVVRQTSDRMLLNLAGGSDTPPEDKPSPKRPANFKQPPPPPVRTAAPFDDLVKKIAVAAVARKMLREELQAELEAGRELLVPIDMPQYAMSSAAAGNFAMGVTERKVRDWARAVRESLSGHPDLVAIFDRGPDLAPSLGLPIGRSATRELLVEFLESKLTALDNIIERLGSNYGS